MDALIGEHLERVRAAVLRSHTLATAGDWIRENTFLRGEPFSFKDHEFQRVIVDDPSREKVIRKCSQVGLSELSVRIVLALANILDSSTFIYTLPAAAFAKLFVKTRMDPVIQTSPVLRAALNNTADNMEIKQFNNSFIYVKGTIGQAAAISVPADGVIHDEVDFSDQQVMSNYQSRLTHSPWKIKYKFSTPTVPGFGISAEFDVSRRHWNFAKCNHCGEWFLPDYFKHVVIPGFDGEKKEITKDRLPHLRWEEAKLLCPGCGREPDLGPEHRAWVCENPDEPFEPAGYQVQPFDAPRVISIPSLVEASTKYERFIDFVNFSLGLPSEDSETSITKEDVDRLHVPGPLPSFGTHVAGLDMGLTCHLVIAGADAFGRVAVVKRERIRLNDLPSVFAERRQQYRIGLTVMDSLPYTDMLLRLQAMDPNLYGAVYVATKNLALYSIHKTEKREDAGEGDRKAREGEERERQVDINRNRALDSLMEFIRSGNLVVLDDDPEEREIFTQHLMDMKRIREFTTEREMTYIWQKSAKGRDHYHHALLYAYIASKMRSVGTVQISVPWLVSTFRVERPKRRR